MVGAPGFQTWEEMQSSQWLSSIRSDLENNIWPQECQRCERSESVGEKSIRELSTDKHRILSAIKKDYLILGGVLDNVCNSACQSCNANLSTKIGSLESKNYIRIDNRALLEKVPANQIVEVDLNGGEPTASPTYQRLLDNLPPNTKILRVNTNGSRVLPSLDKILDQGIHTIITLSLDGVGKTHDYVRWPITWDRYIATVEKYLEYAARYRFLDLQAWTTLHALNAKDLVNIESFCDRYSINHSWGFLVNPQALDARFTNTLTLSAKHILESNGSRYKKISQMLATLENNQQQLDEFIQRQDRLRNINVKDYI